ncbi:phage shock protein operon transcriptional activator [Kordiimonas sp. SCSIO 12610]|uniref:phage shock protein operon transcriptional activator n=1 Tax=Kordiimonas sp. SCSIO 12610 TaxID=2829597 RepID=UPI00210ED4C6|nr:phage shock protein operon transcriptional activator [Kordiimonas sp. SCSIO 12610]UTW55116.1 phage shock protein operon transcriptional activator [Kordiimonas sp. SCSIO 12610]
MKTTNDQMLGASAAFFELTDQISRAAPLDRPMLVIGERGTGKELIAARLHYLSNRWDRNFQKMNCAALPDTLLESELFGYEPGAFTGANKKRKGRFEVAHKGSLFLDEIGTMSMTAQEKLLRVIEYGEFERVGGNETINVNVRIIGATNIDLPAAADAGEFRHDLLDRLAFDVITVPPLRERQDDILLLAENFGRQMALEQEWLQFPGYTDEAIEAMLEYQWPGNVRELKNVVERAVYRAWDGEEPIGDIVFDPFESPYRPKAVKISQRNGQAVNHVVPDRSDTNNDYGVDVDAPFDFKEVICGQEKAIITKVLEKFRYNQRQAAKHLTLSYDQFRHLMKKHELLS